MVGTLIRRVERALHRTSAAAVEEAAQGCPPCEQSPLNVHPSTVKGGLLSVALGRPLEGTGDMNIQTLTETKSFF